MSLTSAIFLMAFSAGLIASLARHPAFGLYTYIATFYLHPPDRWWGEMLPDIRWSLIAALVTLVSLWRLERVPDRQSWLQNNAIRLLMVFTVWIWMQLAWALDSVSHLELAILYTKYLLLLFLIYATVQSEETFQNVLLTHVLGCFYLGWIVFSAPESGRLDGRFDGVGGPGIDDANALAMQLATGLLAASALVLRGSLRVRAIALAVSPFIVNGIIQTFSRGSVVGLIAGSLVMLLFIPARYRRVYYFLGTLGLVILVQMAPPKFWERLGTIGNPMTASEQANPMTSSEEVEEMDGSSRARIALAEAQLNMAVDYPFGVGHRGTADLSPRYLDREFFAKTSTGDELGSRTSHNTFLSILVEQGVMGAILFGCALVAMFRQLRRLKALDAKDLPEGLGILRAATAGILACVLVSGLFSDYLKTEVFIWFLGLLAVLYDLSPRLLSATTVVDTPVPDVPLKVQRKPARHGSRR